MKTHISVCLLALLTTAAFAEEPTIDADRPGFTNGAGIVPNIQAEAGFIHVRDGANRDRFFGDWTVRVPASDDFEVRFGLPSFHDSSTPAGDVDGFDDSNLGFKWRLPKSMQSEETQLAIAGQTTLPTGAAAFKEDNWQPSLALLVEHEAADWLKITWNGGYTRASNAGVRFDSWATGVCFDHPFNDRLSGYFEFFGIFPAAPGGPDSILRTTGLYYLIGKDTQIDLNYGTDLESATENHYWQAGIAHLF